MLLWTTQVGTAAAAGGRARAFLGHAAFGWQQVDVLIVALAALLTLFIVSTVSRKYWIAEIGFLSVVAAGLISNAIGMIALTVVSLASVLLVGYVLDKAGYSATLTHEDVRRIESAVDTTLRDDLNVGPVAIRAAQSPAGTSQEPGPPRQK